MSEFRFYLFKRTKLSSVLKKKKWRNHVVTGCLKKENETLSPKPPAMQSPGHRAQRFALRCPGRGPGTCISSRFPGDRTLGQEWDPSPSPQRERLGGDSEPAFPGHRLRGRAGLGPVRGPPRCRSVARTPGPRPCGFAARGKGPGPAWPAAPAPRGGLSGP